MADNNIIVLTELAQARAKEELGETDEILQTAPNLLRDNLRDKATSDEYSDIATDLLKCIDQSDLHLLRFLRTRKYDIDEASKNVVGWYRWLHVQQNLPTDMIKAALLQQTNNNEDGDDSNNNNNNNNKTETSPPTTESEKSEDTPTSNIDDNDDDFDNLSYWDIKAKDVRSILDANVIFLLPGYANDGSKVLTIPDISKMIELMRTQPIKKVMMGMNYLLEQASLDPNTQICGLSIVYDLENYSISMLKELMKRKDFIELQKQKAKAMNDAYPFRFGNMWMYDSPWYFKVVWTIIKLFLKKKLRNRIHLSSKKDEMELNKLHENISKSNLPKCFGGELDDDELHSANKAWIEERIKVEG